MILPEFRKRAQLLRRHDTISVSILAVLILSHALLIPFHTVEPTFLTSVMLSVFVLLVLQGGYMTRLCFKTLPERTPNQENARTNHFFYGVRLTFFTPVIALVILLPWIVAGVFTADDMGVVASGFILLLLLSVALLISPIVALLVIAPIKLIIRGVVGLLMPDKKQTGFLFIGAYIALFTTFAIMMAFAVDIDTVYPASTVPLISSLLGIPANYDIINEGLLWVARLLLAVLIVSLIGFARFGNKKSPRKPRDSLVAASR